MSDTEPRCPYCDEVMRFTYQGDEFETPWLLRCENYPEIATLRRETQPPGCSVVLKITGKTSADCIRQATTMLLQKTARTAPAKNPVVDNPSTSERNVMKEITVEEIWKHIPPLGSLHKRGDCSGSMFDNDEKRVFRWDSWEELHKKLATRSLQAAMDRVVEKGVALRGVMHEARQPDETVEFIEAVDTYLSAAQALGDGHE